MDYKENMETLGKTGFDGIISERYARAGYSWILKRVDENLPPYMYPVNQNDQK